MCGRFGSVFSGEDLTEYYSLDKAPDFEITKNYNTAPSQQIIAVTHKSPLVARKMYWGFVPSWASPKTAKIKPINARAEKIESGFYKSDFKTQRCIIPASYFIEWKSTANAKIPYVIEDDEIMSFAGLYAKHIDAEGKNHYMCAIITTTPNAHMKKIHNRMPVIIKKQDLNLYLEGEFDEAKRLLSPYSGKLKSYRVGTAINNTKNNSPDIIKPLEK